MPGGKPLSGGGWIGVDLDGTLANYNGWGDGSIGAPIPLMLARVKAWIADGRDVRIFTARMAAVGIMDIALGRSVREEDVVIPIRDWCVKHVGCVLPVTNIKDFGMVELWDDRAVQVVPNTGKSISDVFVGALNVLERIREASPEQLAEVRKILDGLHR